MTLFDHHGFFFLPLFINMQWQHFTKLPYTFYQSIAHVSATTHRHVKLFFFNNNKIGHPS